LVYFLESKQDFQIFKGPFPPLFNLLNDRFRKPVLDSVLLELVEEMAREVWKEVTRLLRYEKLE
jgi:hypothetical protein